MKKYQTHIMASAKCAFSEEDQLKINEVFKALGYQLIEQGQSVFTYYSLHIELTRRETENFEEKEMQLINELFKRNGLPVDCYDVSIREIEGK